MEPMKIGITGTRSGCTKAQFSKLQSILETYTNTTEFHHGDCVGVDAEAALLAKTLGMRIVSHPSEKDELRAYVPYDECKEKFSHFKRNRNIVDSVNLLIVIPWQSEWSSNGGTWYTHDYARRRDKRHGVKTLIIWPDGTTEYKEK